MPLFGGAISQRELLYNIEKIKMKRLIIKTTISVLLCCLPVLGLSAIEIPPAINNLAVNNISETSATITWETDFETMGQINYGTSLKTIFNASMDLNKSKNHKVVLNNLMKGTYYHYRIVTKISNKAYQSKVYNFITKGIPLPQFLNTKIKIIKPEYAEIPYLLNTPSKIILTCISKKDNKKKTSKVKKHTTKGSIKLNNLTPGTFYYYTLEAINKLEERSKTPILNFTTPPLNYAINKKVSGTFNTVLSEAFFSKKSSVIKRITDGKMDYNSGMAISGDIDQEDQFVIIDLKNKQKIKKINVYWRALAYSKDYSIYISKDNKKWEKAVGNISAANGKNIRGEKGDPIKVNSITFNPTSGRYVKLFIKKGSKYHVKHKKWHFVQLMEIMVF